MRSSSISLDRHGSKIRKVSRCGPAVSNGTIPATGQEFFFAKVAPVQSITDIVLLDFWLMLLSWIIFSSYTIIYFFVKNFFFFWSSYVSEYDIRNVFLLRKEPSIKYIRNWWGMGDHPKCVQLRTGWRARQASCVRAHLHYLFSCSWQQFCLILFCFVFYFFAEI